MMGLISAQMALGNPVMEFDYAGADFWILGGASSAAEYREVPVGKRNDIVKAWAAQAETARTKMLYGFFERSKGTPAAPDWASLDSLAGPQVDKAPWLAAWHAMVRYLMSFEHSCSDLIGYKSRLHSLFCGYAHQETRTISAARFQQMLREACGYPKHVVQAYADEFKSVVDKALAAARKKVGDKLRAEAEKELEAERAEQAAQAAAKAEQEEAAQAGRHRRSSGTLSSQSSSVGKQGPPKGLPPRPTGRPSGLVGEAHKDGSSLPSKEASSSGAPKAPSSRKLTSQRSMFLPGVELLSKEEIERVSQLAYPEVATIIMLPLDAPEPSPTLSFVPRAASMNGGRRATEDGREEEGWRSSSSRQL